MVVWDVLERIGFLLYLVDPRKHSFERTESIPSYVLQVLPLMAIFLILEQCILFYKKKPTFRANQASVSISHMILEEFSSVCLRRYTTFAYIWIYNNWRIITLPWDSLWTWVITFIAIDFLYYWGHRASHEINFLWATHQVHHSSEDHNLLSAIRLPIFQTHIQLAFYFPIALVAPPGALVVHSELNLLYQFWLHTEVIKSLGPLEYIINTPSHHRVHHGRNRKYIDKNYGGVLIIFDHIFGTFEPEGDEVVYGLTQPLNSSEPFYIQFYHYIHIFKTAFQIKGIRNKLSVFFKGPGWYPGAPWCGNIEDVPDVKPPVQKYDPNMSLWRKIYVLYHCVILVLGYMAVLKWFQPLPATLVYTVISFEVFSLSVIGMLIEGRSYAPLLELGRCMLFLILDLFLFPLTEIVLFPQTIKYAIVSFVRVTYGISLLAWIKVFFGNITIKLYSQEKEKCL